MLAISWDLSVHTDMREMAHHAAMRLMPYSMATMKSDEDYNRDSGNDTEYFHPAGHAVAH